MTIKTRPWNPLHRYSRLYAWYKGGADGKKRPPVPAWQAGEQPPYLREVREAAEKDMTLLEYEWAREDARLAKRACAAQETEQQLQAAYDRAAAAHAAARARYEEVNQKPAPATEDGRERAYRWLVGFLGAAELPLNVLAFDFFGDSLVFSVVAATAVAGVLLSAAHFLGERLHRAERWTWGTGVQVALLVAVPLALLIAMAYLRVELAGDADASEQVVFWTLLLLNGGIFLVATVAAYRAHPEGIGEVRRTRRAEERVRRSLEQATKARTDIVLAREKAFEAKQAEVHHLQETVDRLAETYRDGNLLRRTDRETHETYYPASYQARLVLQVPERLQRLTPLDQYGGRPLLPMPVPAREPSPASLQAETVANGQALPTA